MAMLVFDGPDHYAGLPDVQARRGALQWFDVVVYDGKVSLTTGCGGNGLCVRLTVTSLNLVEFGGAFGTYLASGFVGCTVLSKSEVLSPY